ncbi:acyltransferase [Achromobacter sp. SD115]|uniref:acyltransferase family protein n=1 Tax=Achromobacter sp. SD115 TaxID=2782011 RepID=UPI001A970105|nr:acyltransferase [Achromobacter sp. SD115]MBO1016709.1 acyltransferase [Achromobacter sp. SD115]
MIQNIPALTGVRGYAALWVVLMHYTWGGGMKGEGLFMQILLYGFSGVIVFLVLSGFVMAHVYPEFRKSVNLGAYGSYFYKRVARIYPLHLVTLLAFLALMEAGYPLRTPNETAFTFGLNLLLIQAWGFVNQFSWNALSWTISVEMFAYIWFPFAALILFKLPKVFAAAVMAAMVWILMKMPHIGLLQAAGVDTSNIVLSHGNFLVQFTSVFIAGVALYRVVQDINKLPTLVSDALVVAGIAILGYACTVPFQSWIMTCGALLLIGGLLCNKGLGHLLFGNRVSVFLGEISYSLYLTHFLLNVVMSNEIVGLRLADKISLAICTATISYYLIERPSRNLLRKLGTRKKAAAQPAVVPATA